MRVHNLFKDNIKLIRSLFNAGIIPVGVFTSLERYEYYNDARNLKIKKPIAIKMTMDYFKCSKRTIYNSIEDWESAY